jgi:hypothetical protein
MFDHLFHVTPPEVDHEKVLDNTIVLKGKDGRYLSYDELSSHAKAEALFPIIVASCLNLSSSTYKHVMQDIFGRLVFHARTSLCGFVVTRKGSDTDLTDEATSYLHGRLLKNVMGLPEEAFIRSVILTDFLRYHFDRLGHLSKKYRHLLPCKHEDYKSIVTLLASYEGVKATTKVEKGFRDSDIRFFQNMKSVVIAERRSPSGTEGRNDATMKTFFTFHYPGSSRHLKKESNAVTNGNKRKRNMVTGDFLGANETSNSCKSLSMAMPLYFENVAPDSVVDDLSTMFSPV